MAGTELTQALTALQQALRPVRLPLATPDAVEQTQAAHAIAGQLNDYVLPRLRNIEAPLLTVVGGSTGAGKSTLVNTLIGRPVSAPGVIRPTTRSPVLVFNPSDQQWFSDDRILPGLTRTKSASIDTHSLQLVAEQTLPTGLALLDAPDIDSVVDENRKLATQLLEAADLWLFVTSAARYADAVPWTFLQSAAGRGAAVAVVLDRVPPDAMNVVATDLGRMMSERGLADSPLFAVPATSIDVDSLLPDAAVAPIRGFLASLAADKDHREQVVRRTLDGAIGSLTQRAAAVAGAIDAQADVLDQLREDAAKSYAEASRAVAIQSADGTLMRGEVLSRWHDFVGTSEFARVLDQKVSWLRDRLVGAFKGSPPEGEKLAVAAQFGLEALIREEGEAAAERAGLAWQANPAGRALIGANTELAKVSVGYPSDVSRLIRNWQSDVMQLVADQGKNRRNTARIAALGVNGVGAALMLVIFAHTGGLTGAEVGVAGGTSVLAQRLLESIFGDDAVRKLATVAKSDLDARVEGVMASELVRFTRVLDEAGVSRAEAQLIRDAVAQVQVVRGVDTQAGTELPAGNQPVAVGIDHEDALALEPGAATRLIRLDRFDEHDGEIVDAELVRDEEPGVGSQGRGQ